MREKKAQRTRERIVDEGLALFARDGYEATTMESIAEAAEISASTLYRAYPTKDSVILAPIRKYIDELCGAFARHSENGPVEAALAEAILTVLELNDRQAARALLVRSIIDRSPDARARLWDYVYMEQEELSQLIAERIHAKADDLHVVLTAQVAMTILGLAADRWRESGGKSSSARTATELMKLLRQGRVIFPNPQAQPIEVVKKATAGRRTPKK